MAVASVGTGFGVALMRSIVIDNREHGVLVTPTELGHITTSIYSRLEEGVSGRALVRAYTEKLGRACPGLDARAIAVFAHGRQAVAKNQRRAAKYALDRGAEELGRAALNVVLAHGAWSGVLCLGEFSRTLLRLHPGAVAKGRAGVCAFPSTLSTVPVVPVRGHELGLVGAGVLAQAWTPISSGGPVMPDGSVLLPASQKRNL
jgi:glucokinase